MDRQPVLEGERLLLRPLEPADWDALFAVASDPQIWAVHPMHNRWQEPVFRAFFADALDKRGALAVIEKSSGEVVGSSRFQGYDPMNGGSVEIGWTFLARRLWGSGANAEMKRLMLAHALGHVEVVNFRVGEDNVISRKAMEHIGGRLTDQIDMTDTPNGPVAHVVYEITRESFATGPLSRAA
ncbi:GNAT family N-acetyltransferase [Altererythrobacter salegens]|uniref:GNAT family N-acetyltransferase n=1 Tax=Croceibacterium salegens TaxID=1737568 RepID=A0A6I4T3I2_9SPHN|nr:GNAT family N-acetyltransferase [Croceibacterium salegens]MXO61322.1 GNAT family N-acetyltransferase [Croceibacterium salegens]